MIQLSLPNINEHSPYLVEFFSKNEAALLYICETGDGMQKMRHRLFHFWFGVYAEHDEYLFLPQFVYDEEDN